jgi:putative ATP-dependent endonuclease of the OLD family
LRPCNDSNYHVRIQSITIAGFRCFGPDPQLIEVTGDLTAIVGPNASGKTAVLQALCTLFGVTRAQRTVRRSDFHLPPGVPPDDRTKRSLFVDVIIALPELAKGSATAHTVAPAFRHMQIAGPKATPICRMRLEAQWEDDGTAEGEVTQNLCWVDKLGDEITDDDKRTVSALDRGHIQVYYTPATRDAETQIRASTGALAARLLRAIEWSTKTRDTVDAATKELSKAFGAEAGIDAISAALSDRWKELHDEKTDTDPALALTSQRFEVVARIQVLFQQGPAAIERGLDALSDGQQSLFYFALAAAVFDLERAAVGGKIKGFRADELRIPALSIFAIEEPENHLSPYYLARIVQQVRSIIAGDTGQAFITSHAPAVLSRVNPEEVRYCRCDEKTRVTSVKAVKLPEEDDEAVKFVRGAMLAFPELYFARFVVLVEGDSERIVLPRLAEADGFLVDTSFVAIVPLGGRHVEHFWRLLNGLSIPFATLLDLDFGRSGGGFGRVKTIVNHLLDAGVPRTKLLAVEGGELSQKDLDGMHEWGSSDAKVLRGWTNDLGNYGVFFSEPLDLDMAMLAAYPEAYEAIIPKGGGPKMKPEDAAKVVLGEGGAGLDAYKDQYSGFDQHMPAYRYHFLTHSKPATHLRAFAHLDEEALETRMPKTYRTLLKYVINNLKRD